MDFKMHEYTHAVVGKVTPALRITDRADLNDARRQHDCFLRLLRELNLEVVEVDFGYSFPENVLLEHISIVCHGIALLMKPTSSMEDDMLKILKEVMQKDLGQTVIELTDPYAKVNGSDVIFTGREFFVGISDTSNEAGASAVAEAFPEFPCTPIKMSKGARHLKSYITVAGPDILCVGASKEAQELLKRMEREATFSYQTLTVPEDEAANCLYINGTLIHRAIEEIPDSFKTFCEKIDFARRSICFSELAKISTGLSACALLVRKT
ncbi:N(G),N(G)-dimethylarginine dimethylaminohydrolase 1 [Papilio machaon]|uniref:N(G),N(G)-dimethylarginine dimethylaminohydrolase 1 n=1 Tax=Papilio machaon TaxID=76193 RepID=A0A194QUZ5_PAPMA|nr:N(G),N(G)-dimethylarginine dimethylaminohydrolase 1 [Papilio machaon]KPJ09139.1 N(G),N(G)-dimethylarginine dimethylaminohydrolase 1 [Papilio machaon]